MIASQAKIDEEMAKINVDIGVYLPSNAYGRVFDIDKESRRPLQSHGKVSSYLTSNWVFIKHLFSIGTFHGNFQSQKGTSRDQLRS